ncbi:MAG: ATP-binding cassette domain-containing protein [Acidimicrobiales bacterium]
MAELTVHDVSVRFGGVRALDGVSLEVPAGAVTGLIGPNGAGKTTLFDVVTGLRRPERGGVRLDGVDITRLAPHQRARRGVSRTFQRLELFGTLTARENVQMAAETAGRRGPAALALAGELLERAGLSAVADTPADLLPTGLARLLELARALATDPSVLLLDEPSAGLDGEETDALGRLLSGLAEAGLAVLLVEHDMQLVMSTSHRVVVLDAGTVIARGEPAEVRADPAVQQAYLGGGVVAERRAPARAGEGGAAPALELRGVRAGYGRIEVLHGIDLAVPRGAVVALLGPNGAGKSTLLKVASGRLAPTGGTVHLQGADVTGSPPERLVAKGLCTVPEGRAVFPNLTVAENLRLFAARAGVTRAEVEERSYARFPVLAARRRQLAGRLSGGEQQMLGVARALATSPSVLLLDELSMGLAPLVVEELYDAVAAVVAAEQVTVLLVEQFAQTALAIADLAAVMVQGTLTAPAPPGEVAGELIGSYFGDAGGRSARGASGGIE